MSCTNVVAIVQARMGSTRLPNKMMLHLKGYPVVEWVARRVKCASKIDDMLFAIPETPIDDILEIHLKGLGVKVFRGSENDVIKRFHDAAIESGASHIVRVCADNPLVSPKEIDRLVDFYFTNHYDYAYNHVPINNNYPDGLGAEMASFAVIETIQYRATIASQREHVFNYVWDNACDFTIGTFEPDDHAIAHPDVKLDIDDYGDYRKFIEKDIRIDMTSVEIVSVFC